MVMLGLGERPTHRGGEYQADTVTQGLGVRQEAADRLCEGPSRKQEWKGPLEGAAGGSTCRANEADAQTRSGRGRDKSRCQGRETAVYLNAHLVPPSPQCGVPPDVHCPVWEPLSHVAVGAGNVASVK